MTITRWTAAFATAAIFAAGAGAAYLLRPRPAIPGADTLAGRTSAPAPAPSTGVIRIAAELAARGDIVVETAATAAVAAPLRLPGVVQPNAYRQVSVTPLVAGRVTRVLVELGQRIARGAAIAEVYSPDVAQARAGYLNAMADTAAGEARLRRTERLAALGSASQQELEQVRAEHVRHESEMREAAARLTLLGIDRPGLDDAHADRPSTVIVRAPQDGVVILRPAIAGMTVEASSALVTIADLSPVWIIADVYERDLAAVRVGAGATLSAAGYPGVEWRGRITYISPDIRPETRTAQVRIEVANPDATLKFGMFVEVAIAGTEATGVAIPLAAVQTIGADTVVFVPEGSAPGLFRERRVSLGPAQGTRVMVREGIAAGERLVTAGSFALRAEAERQGVRPGSTQTAAVRITTAGFEPASLTLARGVPASVTFTRLTDRTCATEVVIPAYGIRRALPLNQPVTVTFVPAGDGTAFQCGMGMLTGALVVR